MECLVIASVLLLVGNAGCQLSKIMKNQDAFQVAYAGNVTWAHAVNSLASLRRELSGGADFLEADVSLGQVIGEEYNPFIPIMAHPPNTSSDISLDTWLDLVIARNTGKGVKLDFKSIEATEPSLIILQKYGAKLNFSLWLNADILSGPINSPNMPVDADRFLTLCHQYFPRAVMSVGWTTFWGPAFPEESWLYEWNHVRKMADIIRCFGYENNPPNFTFPVRGVFASRSIKELQWLLAVVPGSTLTVWSPSTDPLKLQDLTKVRTSFPERKVYYDIPEPINTEFLKAKYSNDNVLNAEIPLSEDHWMSLTRGQGDPCSSYTYISNNTIVFGKTMTNAVLLKNLLYADENHILKVKGKIFFFGNDEMMPSPSPSVHELSIVLVDVSLFSKNTSHQSEERLDLTESDTDVLWSAFNASQLHKFEHVAVDRRSACRMFSLDTGQERSFEVWTVPCDVLHDEDTFESAAKNGIQEISSRKRLVLPKGPFMLGFVSAGNSHVVVYDLEVKGRKEGLSSVAPNFKFSFAFLITVIFSYVIYKILL